ncbi:MAG: helix-turn-helix domain-containing protein [Syntrophomonas sp.]|uniref:helix-turn-helix domain-containing protein n=1 Tax=Syntrophomonas sp. TaxID=2053627 RepID=UPI00262F7EA9|nr:helix-turn-helix domain-containing protein [Syntrophomonas sp.]MDD2510554.1 helix-turn-helix domain-containing protein [Syntrophomonas sp.]MDD3880357.1 helix-turn-helix domain-containing protein [Syntrophomonas sp.]MDD4626677.1 helix-turn-helix domain-containing protein [Syntrophomonas sp.]
MEHQNKGKGSFPPWSRMPSLAEMSQEAGVDFDELLDCIEKGKSSQEMAEKFQVSNETVESLRQHFIHYGISSVIGGD